VRCRPLGAALLVPAALAAAPAAVISFSSLTPGSAPAAAWRELVPPRAKAPSFALVDENGTTVLRVRSEAAAGTLAQTLHEDLAARNVLAWRWKIDHVVAKGDLAAKSGDDFAARVYAFFDVPVSRLPFSARVRILLARLLYGSQLPTTAICYVWDNRHPVGTSAWSPYTDRVRVVVLESGDSRAGRWVPERRDLVADYRLAFGDEGPLPALSGIAAGNDTDQTGERATAWFGDFRLEAAGGAR